MNMKKVNAIQVCKKLICLEILYREAANNSGRTTNAFYSDLCSYETN